MDFFRESLNDTVAVVESAEDKCMDKFFKILQRQKSFNLGYVLKVKLG